MKPNFKVDKFFNPLRLDHPISDADYDNVASYIKALSAFSRIANMSVYVIDYHKKEFLYVSSNPLFLCGYKAEEVRELGYDFYPKILSPETLTMLLEINDKGFEFFYNQEPEARSNLFISYDFEICHKRGSKLIVNHKLTPFVLTHDYDMWLSLCLVTLSTRDKSGHAFIQNFDSLTRHEYSFKSKRWKAVQSVMPTEREREVLQLAALGHTEQGISDKLFIDKATVKFHKTNAIKKLGVNNIMEAVYYATVNQLI